MVICAYHTLKSGQITYRYQVSGTRYQVLTMKRVMIVGSIATASNGLLPKEKCSNEDVAALVDNMDKLPCQSIRGIFCYWQIRGIKGSTEYRSIVPTKSRCEACRLTGDQWGDCCDGTSYITRRLSNGRYIRGLHWNLQDAIG